MARLKLKNVGKVADLGNAVGGMKGEIPVRSRVSLGENCIDGIVYTSTGRILSLAPRC